MNARTRQHTRHHQNPSLTLSTHTSRKTPCKISTSSAREAVVLSIGIINFNIFSTFRAVGVSRQAGSWSSRNACFNWSVRLLLLLVEEGTGVLVLEFLVLVFIWFVFARLDTALRLAISALSGSGKGSRFGERATAAALRTRVSVLSFRGAGVILFFLLPMALALCHGTDEKESLLLTCADKKNKKNKVTWKHYPLLTIWETTM